MSCPDHAAPVYGCGRCTVASNGPVTVGMGNWSCGHPFVADDPSVKAIELRLAEAETRLTYLRKAQEVDQAAYQRLAARAVAALDAMADAQASPVRTARKPTPRRASRAGSGTARAPRSPKRAPRR